MAQETVQPNGRGNRTMENIAYIRQMLAELRMVAENEGADMLCYLIEMAYVEAATSSRGAGRCQSTMVSETNPPACRSSRPAMSSSRSTR